MIIQGWGPVQLTGGTAVRLEWIRSNITCEDSHVGSFLVLTWAAFSAREDAGTMPLKR